MAKDLILREKFTKYILKNWELNNRCEDNIRCVYAILSFDYIKKNFDIAYIGSTTCLKQRWKSHKIPYKIEDLGLNYCLFFKKMNKGFYDFEIKLIKKLKPIFNKQHKK